MPDGLKIWMESYKEKIYKLKISTNQISSIFLNEWDKLEDQPWDPDNPDNPTLSDITKGPLLTTKWGQGSGYNTLLTPINNELPPTGCVATAMAQVMKYYNYPMSYNWSIMPNTYGTTETAKLMKDIGVAVNMTYDLDGSGADVEKEVASSFINDFGYSNTAQFIGDYLSNYDRVTQEIDVNRPVIFRGGTKKYWAGIVPYYADGHCWICHGYKKVNRTDGSVTLDFLMNWGWNGNNDGYYSFSNFNPGTYDFNYKVGIVVGIKP